MNFNNLPDEIKFVIFNINREKQIEIEKEKFAMSLDSIKDINDYAKSADNYDENKPIHHMLHAIDAIRSQGYGALMFYGN